MNHCWIFLVHSGAGLRGMHNSSGSLKKEFIWGTSDRQYFKDLRLSVAVMFEPE